MKAETWYSASEAVKAGLADHVVGEEPGTSNSWDLTIFNYSGRDNAPEPEIVTKEAVSMSDMEPIDAETLRRYLQEAFR